MIMKRKLITAFLVLLALLLTGCSKEDCQLLIGEYTQQLGNDVIKKVREFEAAVKPENYTLTGTMHTFIVEATNCR